MNRLSMKVGCMDCGRVRALEAESPIIPIVGGYSCLSDGIESSAKKCICGCEAFLVLELIE